jgi:hypothetical protein
MTDPTIVAILAAFSKLLVLLMGSLELSVEFVTVVDEGFVEAGVCDRVSGNGPNR